MTWDAESFDRFERAGWSGRSDAYRDGFGRLAARFVEPLLDAAGVGTGTRVLDVGCGPGTVSAAALRRGAEVTAVDASPEMAALASRTHPGLDVRTALLDELPFPDGQFTALVGNFVINHLGDPAAGLAEIRRVLAPGGRLALTCWEKEAMRALALFGESVAESGVPYPDGVPLSGPFLADSTAPDLPTAFYRLLADAGFASADVDTLRLLHRVDPDRWWSDVTTGTPLTGTVVSRLDPASLAAVRRTYDRKVAAHAVGDGFVALPAVALLGSATRPE
ncbi:class I SAM-dependent methyltransferase [Streptomyces pinistramenti]|uniref:class I SAM-dependent methyltransferase n=1 Tax=Streptomyces pinistramenti TaxID=2884812 RepID=UPI001D063C12|nr:class I SAM-dependent methyltransferase [Streptomyces pinistramenti]MCB5910588.1 methyltransferase domain-containing protein [Streptomyces pinistramenti]